MQVSGGKKKVNESKKQIQNQIKTKPKNLTGTCLSI